MEYKPSFYNVNVTQNIFFNTVSGAFLRTTPEQEQLLNEEASISIMSDKMSEPLIKSGFLVPQAVRENKLLKARWYKAVNSDRSPTLTIAPTMNCNFGCDYCFETHEVGHMSPHIRDQLIKFIETELAAQAQYQLSVTWFGGEPLMGLPVILDLSDRFNDLVSKGVLESWKAFMITNGHLLTPKTISKLANKNITGFQVTIDGPREIHDMRRVLKVGRKATFDTICDNLAKLPEHYDLSIRVNVDRRNSTHLEELMEQLNKNGVLTRSNTSVYLANVENYDRPDIKDSKTILSNSEFANVQQKFKQFCDEYGYPCADESISTSLDGVCQVDNVNAYVVDCDGTLMKCWAELRNKPKIVAHLNDPNTWSNPNLTSFEDRDPFDDPECMSCQLLPLCMGSCPKLREMRRKFDFKMCPPIKTSLKSVLNRKIEDLKIQEGSYIQDKSTQLEEIIK